MSPTPLAALALLRRRDEERARASLAAAAVSYARRERGVEAARRAAGSADAPIDGAPVSAAELRARAAFARRLDCAVRAAAGALAEARRTLDGARAEQHRAHLGATAVERRIEAERAARRRARDLREEDEVLEIAGRLRRA